MQKYNLCANNSSHWKPCCWARFLRRYSKKLPNQVVLNACKKNLTYDAMYINKYATEDAVISKKSNPENMTS